MDSETVSLEILDAGSAVRRAEKAVELDSPLRAMGLLSELKRRFPGEARLWHLSGRILETMGCDRAAEENYRQAHLLDPCREDFVLDLAELLYQGDRVAEAEALAAAMASRYPDSARALGLLGVARAERGASPEAEATLRRALALDPGSSRVARRLALLLCRRGDAPGHAMSSTDPCAPSPTMPALFRAWAASRGALARRKPPSGRSAGRSIWSRRRSRPSRGSSRSS